MWYIWITFINTQVFTTFNGHKLNTYLKEATTLSNYLFSDVTTGWMDIY